MTNLNGVAELEAKVTFLSAENLDLKNEVELSRKTSSLEISRLSEQIAEMKEDCREFLYYFGYASHPDED